MKPPAKKKKPTDKNKVFLMPTLIINVHRMPPKIEELVPT